jgi:hypothetical protein
MEGIIIYTQVFSSLLKTRLPRLSAHLDHLQVRPPPQMMSLCVSCVSCVSCVCVCVCVSCVSCVCRTDQSQCR